MEERIASQCQDILGVDEKKAILLIQAHRAFIRVARRRGLIDVAQAEAAEKELNRLESLSVVP